jgi:hypothetical protein
VFVFVFFGLVATVGSTYVQDEAIPPVACSRPWPVGLLAVAILVANNLRDRHRRAAGKRTLAVRLGERATRLLYAAMVVAAFADLAAGRGASPALAARSALLAAAGAVPALVPPSARSSPAPSARDLVPVLVGDGRCSSSSALLAAGMLPSLLAVTPLAAGDAAVPPSRCGLRFRRVTEREGVLLRGPAGWGEFSPFPEYPPAVRPAGWRRPDGGGRAPWPPARATAVPGQRDRPRRRPGAGARDRQRVRDARPPRSRSPSRGRRSPTTTSPARGGARRARADGRLRVDANGAWDVDEAVAALRALDRFDLEYAEQPSRRSTEMAALRRRVDVPLAADESVRTAEDPLRSPGSRPPTSWS